MSQEVPEVAVVAAWHEALDAGDVDRLAALSHDEIELVGPRGVASGRAVVRDWVGRAGARFEPLRWFHRDGSVVVEQRARWRGEDTGEAGAPIVVATAFRVRDGLVARLARFDDVAAALAAAGLDEATELPRRGADGPGRRREARRRMKAPATSGSASERAAGRGANP